MKPVHRFSTYVGENCVKVMKSVHEMGPALGIEPRELLDMINGKIIAPPTVVRGLARELQVDLKTLETMAEDLRKEIRGRVPGKR